MKSFLEFCLFKSYIIYIKYILKVKKNNIFYKCNIHGASKVLQN